jgi:hypothetical protein
MSRIEKGGKRMRGWRTLVEGDVERPLPIGSVATMNQRAGSSASPGPMRKSRRRWLPVSEAQTRIALSSAALSFPCVTYDCR